MYFITASYIIIWTTLCLKATHRYWCDEITERITQNYKLFYIECTDCISCTHAHTHTYIYIYMVRILRSAQEHNLSPFDSKIACLCKSIKINNNKHVYIIHLKTRPYDITERKKKRLHLQYPRKQRCACLQYQKKDKYHVHNAMQNYVKEIM